MAAPLMETRSPALPVMPTQSEGRNASTGPLVPKVTLDAVQSHAEYISEVMQPGRFEHVLRRLENQYRELVEACSDVPTHVLVRGVSGNLVGCAIAHRLGLELIVSRKHDGSHSERTCEISRYTPEMNIVFVDDFVASGATLRKAWKSVCDNVFNLNTRKWGYIQDYDADHEMITTVRLLGNLAYHQGYNWEQRYGAEFTYDAYDGQTEPTKHQCNEYGD